MTRKISIIVLSLLLSALSAYAISIGGSVNDIEEISDQALESQEPSDSPRDFGWFPTLPVQETRSIPLVTSCQADGNICRCDCQDFEVERDPRDFNRYGCAAGGCDGRGEVCCQIDTTEDDSCSEETLDFSDFLSFSASFGSEDAEFDYDGDGTVGFGDFLIFVKNFGGSCSHDSTTQSLPVRAQQQENDDPIRTCALGGDFASCDAIEDADARDFALDVRAAKLAVPQLCDEVADEYKPRCRERARSFASKLVVSQPAPGSLQTESSGEFFEKLFDLDEGGIRSFEIKNSQIFIEGTLKGDGKVYSMQGDLIGPTSADDITPSPNREVQVGQYSYVLETSPSIYGGQNIRDVVDRVSVFQDQNLLATKSVGRDAGLVVYQNRVYLFDEGIARWTEISDITYPEKFNSAENPFVLYVPKGQMRSFFLTKGCWESNGLFCVGETAHGTGSIHSVYQIFIENLEVDP